MFEILRRLALRKSPPSRIDDDSWSRLFASARLLRGLDADQRVGLHALCERFLAEKNLSAAGGFALNPPRALALAALSCLPVLNLGFEYLGGWRDLIVYPGRFRVRRHDYDEDSGVLDLWDEDLAGEAWEHGPVVLSWADVRADLRRPQAGFNVVAHEIAHKIDLLDGVLDGTPPLPTAARVDWIRVCQSAFDYLRAEIEAGRETPIDDYAATSEGEFFAVVSEYHYSAPTLLATVFPAVAAQLVRFYGASPI